MRASRHHRALCFTDTDDYMTMIRHEKQIPSKNNMSDRGFKNHRLGKLNYLKTTFLLYLYSNIYYISLLQIWRDYIARLCCMESDIISSCAF